MLVAWKVCLSNPSHGTCRWNLKDRREMHLSLHVDMQ